ncbi:hypothetical protein DY000_02018931 [Brassica cretica]|uniref:AAA+ ATPase domain-containing protein n=1 Tax=Brassica cretica TaxID=69181 RepID=A0ABQ7CZU5_BRACR|nr:hypothetical protein DY000_02018931 [Brassica cretica]
MSLRCVVAPLSFLPLLIGVSLGRKSHVSGRGRKTASIRSSFKFISEESLMFLEMRNIYIWRKPLARFPSGDWVISEMPVTQQDLKLAVSKVFDIVGRVVSGSAEIIRDLIEGGGSILVIGSPGVGKTTLIRKRVVIVDMSNEIGGDGDVPHSGIGRARRMQIPNVNLQHDVMIEAVENHMPEIIIIDVRGVQLVTPIPSETMFLIS